MQHHGTSDGPYNEAMIRRRTRLSLTIAISSTFVITMIAVVTLCWL